MKEPRKHAAVCRTWDSSESTAAVLAVRQKWQDSGLLTRDEMKTECCYALQDKTWVRDPDGHEWEVFAVLEDNSGESPYRKVMLRT